MARPSPPGVEAGGACYGIPDPDGAARRRVVRRTSATKPAKLVADGRAAFEYTFDMGDAWEHRIIVGRLRAADPDLPYPVFPDGERRRPREDCGSASGYCEFLDAVSGPDEGKGSRRKQDMLTWYGRSHGPDDIDEEQVRAALTRIDKTSRPRRAATIKP